MIQQKKRNVKRISKKRNTGPWSDNEVKKLKQAMKDHPKDYEKMAEVV